MTQAGAGELMKAATAPMGRRLFNLLGPLLGLVLIVFAGGLAEYFKEGTFNYWSPQNQCLILTQTVMVAIGAIGMTMIIISGGIDLSVGSVVALSAVAAAWVVRYFAAGEPAAGLTGSTATWLPLVALGIGIAVGTAAGATNGVLITGLKLAPFIITLGMMTFARGTAKWVANMQRIDTPSNWIMDFTKSNLTVFDVSMQPTAEGGRTALFSFPGFSFSMPFWPERWVGPVAISGAVILTIVLAVAAVVLLARMRFGRHIFAIGSNEETARLCGVAVWRVKVIVFMLGGAFAGLAGLMQFSRLTVGDPTVAVGLELDVIAAVVIGGGSLSGGEGSILGTLVGALIMTVIASGCTQMEVPNYWQEIITGGIIIVAVALDRLRHRRSA